MISGYLIVQDEEECIARALDSMHPYVDEIIVVDSGSTDRTKEIAAGYPKVTVHDLPWPSGVPDDFSVQRNKAVALCNGDYIFSLDADEYIEPYVGEAIGHLVARAEHDAFALARQTFIDGYLTNSLYPDYQVRLFKPYLRYAQKIHEGIVGAPSVGFCNLIIKHYKTNAWQQKDNKRCWDLGQEPAVGYAKVGDDWVLITSENGYRSPKMDAFVAGDFREQLLDADHTSLVKLYDDKMIAERFVIGTSEELAYGPGERPMVQFLRERKTPIERCLEMGCANGRLVFKLVHDGLVKSALGIDISPNMIEYARESNTLLGLSVEFNALDVESFQTEERYGLVLAFALLEHLHDLHSGLAKISIVLTDDGVLAGMVPFMMTCGGPTSFHVHFFNENSLTALLGVFFTDVEVEKVDFYPDRDDFEEFHLIFRCAGRK